VKIVYLFVSVLWPNPVTSTGQATTSIPFALYPGDDRKGHHYDPRYRHQSQRHHLIRF
jgi:hypothetical protein